MNRIMDAAKFALDAHLGQIRKYIPDPYIYHPMRVAGRVMMFPGATEDMVIAAWLHDVLEDTKVTVDGITNQFGNYVTTLVQFLTNGPYEPGMNRAARKAQDLGRLKVAPWEAKIIKMIDRIDNLADFIRVPVDGADPEFFTLYADESLALSKDIGDAHVGLREELRNAALFLKNKYI